MEYILLRLGDHGCDDIPLGLGYLAASLEASGLQVRVLSGNVDAASVIEEVTTERPLLGVSVPYQDIVGTSLVLAKELKRALPGCHICFGGHAATALWAQMMEACSAIDSIALGEGELTLVETAHHIRDQSSLADVAGLARRIGDTVQAAAPRPLIADLDILPFPVRAITNEKSMIGILGSRGCPGGCSFCSIRFFYGSQPGKLWRCRSVANVLAELSELYGQGCRLFQFHDDSFLGYGHAGQERAGAMANELAASFSDIRFAISCRSNDLEQPLLESLHRAGLRSVFLGVESGADSQLARYRKGVTAADCLKAVHLLSRLGIDCIVGLIPFDPDVTLEEVKETLGFLRAAKQERAIMWYGLNRLDVYAGTPVAASLAKAGRLIVGEWTYDYRFADSRIDLLFRKAVSDLQGVFHAYRELAKKVDALGGGLMLLTAWKRYDTEIIANIMDYFERSVEAVASGHLLQRKAERLSELAKSACNTIATWHKTIAGLHPEDIGFLPPHGDAVPVCFAQSVPAAANGSRYSCIPRKESTSDGI